MEYKKFEKKMKGLVEKEIDDYKKLVKSLPTDEKFLAYVPTLITYEDNISHIINVYASARSAFVVGKPLICTEKKDGSLGYQTKEKRVTLKKNNHGMYG